MPRKKAVTPDAAEQEQLEESKSQTAKPKRKNARKAPVAAAADEQQEKAEQKAEQTTGQKAEPKVGQKAEPKTEQQTIAASEVLKAKHGREPGEHQAHASERGHSNGNARGHSSGQASADRGFEPEPISEKDAAFLAPASSSFGLKPKIHTKSQSRQSRFWRGFIYALSIIIILAAAALFILVLNPSKQIFGHGGFILFKHHATKTQQGATVSSATQAQGSFKLVVVNANSDISAIVSQVAAQASAGEVVIDHPSDLISLPVENTDTLFFKTQAQDQMQKLLAGLVQYNIKPQIQNSDSITDDMNLYLVSILPSANLSSQTASVYNATNTAGLAKKYCGYLENYKISSCSALNAAQNQSGITVFYKNKALLPILERLAELQKATFSQADPSQAEDIKIIVGN